jgi:23S rRNA (adenine2030-N6)-methyltransferase
MFAYRHAFHAGNHADVLKHTVLARVLRHMNAKPKPYRLVDTHAGAGGYSLESRYARQKAEFEQGIARLWERRDLPPALAQLLLRSQDQLRCFELHPTDHRILASFLGGMRGAEVHDRDGFDALRGQLPPPTRRGVVLMDPSYEGNKDYGRVVASLRDALARFAEGVYIVWYPQVTKLEAAQLPKRLEALAPRGWLHARLTVQRPDAQGFGLAGSGVFVINPPYTLHNELLVVLPYLVEVLGQMDDANYLIEQRAS